LWLDQDRARAGFHVTAIDGTRRNRADVEGSPCACGDALGLEAVGGAESWKGRRLR
jgi:hypothetical protein